MIINSPSMPHQHRAVDEVATLISEGELNADSVSAFCARRIDQVYVASDSDAGVRITERSTMSSVAPSAAPFQISSGGANILRPFADTSSYITHLFGGRVHLTV
ncbi:hypothetical protein [Bradyrhizobium sp. Rc3b]|uniref:hypothetical protein n=1 Tax=Bradyrhizobium sp. Rc3b TaxID=1855322 RepID=UPI0015A57FE7|nr:hypothetical protein [Bradyrhizobium sp. Rc3b]